MEPRYFYQPTQNQPSSSSTTLQEAQILGALFSEPNLIKKTIGLNDSIFSDPLLKKTWTLIKNTAKAGKPTTPTHIHALFPKESQEIGGLNYMISLVTLGQDILPVFDDALQNIKDAYTWKQIESLSRDIQNALNTKNHAPGEILSKIIKKSETIIKSEDIQVYTKKEIAEQAIEDSLRIKTLMTTGLNNLDILMHGGLTEERLYSISGYTGCGKTVLAGTISENLNAQGHTHLFISIENKPHDIEIRSCARRLDINALHINDKDHPLHNRFIKNSKKYIDSMPNNTYYSWCPGETIDYIERLIIKSTYHYSIKGFILDYWQLVKGKPKGCSLEEHLDDCAERLVTLCRNLGIWGIVMAQSDKSGKLLKAEGLKRSSTLHIHLMREENDETAYFSTEKSNHTRYANIGSDTVPGVIFDMNGPHFRNIESHDVTIQNHDGDPDLML